MGNCSFNAELQTYVDFFEKNARQAETWGAFDRVLRQKNAPYQEVKR